MAHIDLTEDEDEDVKRAIALSLVESSTQNDKSTPIVIGDSPPGITSVTTNTRPPSGSELSIGIPGIDRKAMEAERLARLARSGKRSISPPATRSPRKALKLDSNTVTLPSGARLTSFSALVEHDQNSRKTPAANAANDRLKRECFNSDIKQDLSDNDAPQSRPSQPGSLRYPRGVVKKTWAFGFDRKGDDVKLEEVLEPATLRTAVLSAFQWDVPWVMSKLKTPGNGRGDTKCLFIMQAKEHQLRQQMLHDTQGYRSFLRLCFPPMDGQIHCMHSKLMLLFHKEKLRIAIPTANLLSFDWGESGLMENSVFMIDLPRLPGGHKAGPDTLTDFGRELLHFLSKQKVDHDVCDGLLSFDFAETQGMAFVHTVGGANYKDDAARTGFPGLSRAVRTLGLQSSADLQIDFAASSIGSLKDEFLRHMHAAARGEDMVSADGSAAASSKPKKDFFSKASSKSFGTDDDNVRDKIRLYFPTRETVQVSRAGAAGTICLSREWFEASTFPRSCFRDYKSTRNGLLSHNKIMYARGRNALPASGSKAAMKPVAWVYVGSANMSMSAWGQRIFDRKEKQWKLNCRNWECGVLLSVPQEAFAAQQRGRNGTKAASAMTTGNCDLDSETEDESDDLDKIPAARERQRRLKAAGSKRPTEATAHTDSETEDEDEQRSVTAQTSKTVEMSVFDNLVPPPFHIPGERYGSRQPWYFQDRSS